MQIKRFGVVEEGAKVRIISRDKLMEQLHETGKTLDDVNMMFFESHFNVEGIVVGKVPYEPKHKDFGDKYIVKVTEEHQHGDTVEIAGGEHHVFEEHLEVIG